MPIATPWTRNKIDKWASTTHNHPPAPKKPFETVAFKNVLLPSWLYPKHFFKNSVNIVDMLTRTMSSADQIIRRNPHDPRLFWQGVRCEPSIVQWPVPPTVHIPQYFGVFQSQSHPIIGHLILDFSLSQLTQKKVETSDFFVLLLLLGSAHSAKAYTYRSTFLQSNHLTKWITWSGPSQVVTSRRLLKFKSPT